MASIISFDSKEYHAGTNRDFFAILGLGLRWQSPEAAKTAVTRAMRAVESEIGLPRARELYCSAHIKEERPFDHLRIADRFAELVRGDILEAFFVYTGISPSKVPQIYSQAWRGGMDSLEFLRNILLQAHPVLCAWAMMNDRPPQPDECIWLDHFQGHESLAWSEVRRLRMQIFFRGDCCCPGIAATDMVLAAADNRLRARRLTNMDAMTVFDEMGIRTTVKFLGQPNLKEIVPLSQSPLDTAPYIAHPVYFIMGEERPPLTGRKEWEKTKEWMDVLIKAESRAASTGGCVKWFDPANDSRLMKPGDVFISLGDKSDKIAAALGRGMGLRTVRFPAEPIP